MNLGDAYVLRVTSLKMANAGLIAQILIIRWNHMAELKITHPTVCVNLSISGHLILEFVF